MRKLLLLFFCSSLYAQVGVGTPTPNEDAIIEVVSTDKGILLPRVPLQGINQPNPMDAHVSGMIVFNTAQNGAGINTVYPGLYYNDGTSWIRLNPNTVKIGELKHSFSNADHNGWYLLDGRTVSSLPALAQANAGTIGLSSNLPDAADRFLKAKTGSESLGDTAGSHTFTITQSNLPNINFTGTTNSGGNHNHNLDSFIGSENIGLLSTTLLTLFQIANVAKETTTTASRTSQNSGNHSHSVSFNSGGLNTPVDRTPNYLATNIFIYLGY
ncbi:hypothetical protein ABGT15_07975 [Flavobacterium enshiense]|uniref:hypothetical protein n=1 Tax=Flavobacterium enshiense TaxID=1341165 RepID=UPI00345C9C0D